MKLALTHEQARERIHERRRDDPLRRAEMRTILRLAEARRKSRCPDCEGSGRVAVHVCRDERECRRLCLRVEPCMTCLGGEADALQRSCPLCADHFTPEGTER